MIAVGTKVNNLVVLKDLGTNFFPGKRGRHFECRCDCGSVTVLRADKLGKNPAIGCGCFRGKHRAGGFATKATHRESSGLNGPRTPEYQTWLNIRFRCTYHKNNRWEYYGGRGIKVCERWMNSYDAFLADMGRKPTPEHSIDRVDVDGNYEPGNCRWATRKEQRRNRRG